MQIVQLEKQPVISKGGFWLALIVQVAQKTPGSWRWAHS